MPLILFASCSLLDLFMPDGNDDPDYYDQLQGSWLVIETPDEHWPDCRYVFRPDNELWIYRDRAQGIVLHYKGMITDITDDGFTCQCTYNFDVPENVGEMMEMFYEIRSDGRLYTGWEQEDGSRDTVVLERE